LDLQIPRQLAKKLPSLLELYMGLTALKTQLMDQTLASLQKEKQISFLEAENLIGA